MKSQLLARAIAITLIVWLPPLFLMAQAMDGQVLPGDANNDGVVNNLDILYIGYAYGNLGPARADTSTDPSPQEVAIFWEQTFPDSLNFAFADANGDGFIDTEDLLTVIENYGQSTERITNTNIPDGIQGIHPPMTFDPTNLVVPLTANSKVTLPILLGSEDFPIPNYTGLAFTLEFDTTAIQEINIEIENSWINPDNNAFVYPFINPEQPNRLEIATTRFGPDIIDGSGVIGNLAIVIEDNLIDLLPRRDSAKTVIKLKDILLVDHAFNKIPVAADSVQFMVYHPRLITSITPHWAEGLNVYPTIITNQLAITSPIHFYRIQLLDASGRLIDQRQFEGGTKTFHWSGIKSQPGHYFLRLTTERGALSRKIIIKG